jgi:SpoVK/Ycf46/Vps4 family AAA+-type ATPase
MDDLKYLESNYQFHKNAAKKFLEQNNVKEAISSLKKATKCLTDMASQLSGDQQKLKIETATSLVETIKVLQSKVDASSEKKPEQTVSASTEDEVKEGGEFNRATDTGVTFKDVIGGDNIKHFVQMEWIKRFDPKYKAAYSGKFETPMERGMLLYGFPGTGKTMMAQAIASEVKAVFFSIDASQIVNKYVGETEKAIKRLFDEAAKEERAIVFIDEIDSILAMPKESSQNHEKSALNQWLQMMDGFNKKKLKQNCNWLYKLPE